MERTANQTIEMNEKMEEHSQVLERELDERLRQNRIEALRAASHLHTGYPELAATTIGVAETYAKWIEKGER